MFARFTRYAVVGATLGSTFIVAAPLSAAQSTSRGLISVTQVMQMLDMSPKDRTAQQVLVAYLAGVGEAASIVAQMGGVACKATPSLSADDVRRAINAAAAKARETPATPLIVRDMLDRAGC